MEAQQCVELTSTNRSFGLIIKLSHAVMRELEVVLVLIEDIHSTFGSEPNLYASQFLLSPSRLLLYRDGADFQPKVFKKSLASSFR